MGFGQIVHQQGIAVHVPHGRGVVDRRFLERQDDLVPEPQQRLDDPQIKGKAALHRADVEERARRAGEKLLHLRDEASEPVKMSGSRTCRFPPPRSCG